MWAVCDTRADRAVSSASVSWRKRGQRRARAPMGERKKESGAFIARLRSQRSAGRCTPTHARYTPRGAAHAGLVSVPGKAEYHDVDQVTLLLMLSKIPRARRAEARPWNN